MKKSVSLLLSLLLLFALTAPAFAADSVYAGAIPTGAVRMTAHRGYSAVAPENTLPAFRLAGEYGFWGAECDISTTADGVWVIMHDDTVDRMTDGEGRVADLTFDEIRALTIDAGSNVEQYPGTQVPTLTEYLDVCKAYAMHPVIEIKSGADYGKLDALAALLAARAEKAMFTIITFEASFAARMKVLLPDTPVFLLLGDTTEEALSDSVRFCLDNGLDGVDFACVWNKDMVRAVQRAGLRTMVWTVDDVQTAERYYKWGVRDITTNALTPGKPEGTVWQRTIWALRDFLYSLVRPFACFFEPLRTVC